MASWLRLWHDMPNDPKWRTIARIAAQPIALVQATYLHLLVDASRNVTRGHADVTIEDLASALDVTEEAISAIIDAMQGRVLDGFVVSGWDKRQPSREDAVGVENGAKTAAERKREQRERERDKLKYSQCHEESRNVTQCHAPDTDTDTDTDKTPSAEKPALIAGFDEFWTQYPKKVGKGAAESAWKKAHVNGHLSDVLSALDSQKKSDQWAKDGGQYVPNPATWINQKRWLDGEPAKEAKRDWI